MTSASDTRPTPLLRLDGPEELIALIPYLLGFHPTDSLVAIGLRARRVAFALRLDLPAADDDLSPGTAAWTVQALAAQSLTAIVLVGYGGSARVGPATSALRLALADADLPLVDRLWVAGDRFWSYECSDPDCCPVAGRSYAAARDRIAAEATVAGLVALPDRAELNRLIAPVEGAAREAMIRAGHAAEGRRQSIMDRAETTETGTASLVAAGTAAITEAIARYQAGDGALTDDEAAWLGVVLRSLPVRDLAWERCDSGAPDRHRALWTELVRRVPWFNVAAPAALLGYVCWQQGDGALAGLALARAIETDETYAMAILLSQALAAGVPPSAWRVGPADSPPDPGEDDTTGSHDASDAVATPATGFPGGGIHGAADGETGVGSGGGAIDILRCDPGSVPAPGVAAVPDAGAAPEDVDGAVVGP